MKDEVITVEDRVDAETGRRILHLMSNARIAHPLIEVGQAQVTVEAGVHHLRTEVPMRGAVDIHCEGWVKRRRFVLWALTPGERMSENIVRAAGEYVRLFGAAPMFAFVRALPRGVELGRAIPFMGGEILLFDAEWMVGRSVAVGGRDVSLPVAAC